MKNVILIATAALVGAVAITPAEAGTLTFGWLTPSNENTVLGLSYSQTSGSVTLTAYGLTAPSNLTNPATAGPDLYAKDGGSGETGLGLATDPGDDHEISAALTDGIQIYVEQALAYAPTGSATMTISSVQSGEGWAIYGSNSLLTVAGSSQSNGFLGEPLLTGTGSNNHPTVTVNLPDWGQYSYYTLLATDPGGCNPDANILLGTVTISDADNSLALRAPAPEPGSLLMMGSALIVIGMVMKKARKRD